jgi:phage portal protein BeeE
MISKSPAVAEYPPVGFNEPEAEVVTKMTVMDRFRTWLMPQPKTSPARTPSVYQGGITVLGAQAGLTWKSNAATYRSWSLTPWVRAAINIRRDQIASADWDIVPYEKEGRENKRLAKRIRNMLDSPNAKLDSFHSFAQELIEDIMVLDAGVCEKVRYPDGELAELWPTPGEFIAIDPRWDGSRPIPRYYYIPDGQVRETFSNENMLYMMANPRTISAVGISPIEVLKLVIDSEAQAMDYNRRQVMGAAPNGALNIGETALGSDVEKTRSYWDSNILGQSTMAIIGGYKAPSFMRFNDSNKEMQFREWQDLLLRCIAVVFGLAPMDLGITFDVNRASAEQQADNTNDRGLRPLLDLFQRYITREIVWDESYGGRENNLAFKFVSLDLNETEQKANINKVAVGSTPWKTVNEARVTDGRQPIGKLDDESNIFNHILALTPKGLLDITEGKYVGEEQLAQIAADTQVGVEEAKGEIAARQSEQDAVEAKDLEKVKPKPVVAAKPAAKPAAKGRPK